MDVDVICQVVAMGVIMTLALVGSTYVLLRSVIHKSDPTLRCVYKILLLANLVCLLGNFSGLMIATVAGTWTLGDPACQMFGLTNLVLTSGATWIMAIVAVERYFRFLLASDHPSTFSQKNVNILVAGIYVLVILVATGPLYGLGEYSNFRGHVTLTITANSTMPNVSSADKMADERMCTSLLHQATVIGSIPDPIPCFIRLLESDYGMKTSRYAWVDRGLRILLRAWSEKHAREFWEQYQADGMTSLLSRHLWDEKLLWSARMEHIQFTAHMDRAEYMKYMNIYIPAQDLGHCTVDFTSPHVHATVWSAYQLIITTLFPLLIPLIVYSIIYFRNPYAMSAFDKNLTPEDLSSLRVFCTSSMTSCFITVLYFGVTLANADGSYISPEINFVVTFAYYCSNLSLCVCVCCYDSQCASRLKSSCQTCWLYSKDSISNEIYDHIGLRQMRLPRIRQRRKDNFGQVRL